MKNKSRTKNSFINMMTSLVSNMFSIIIGIVAQALFIKILGSEYLGLNGLFTNVISMLGIVELGIGSAIIYNLYKPIANDDFDTIKSLMRFYKKSYHIIGIIVGLLGIALIPFLKNIVNSTDLPVNITLIYLLFLIDIVFSYFLSYKRSILYANQKNYIVQIIHIIYLVLLNVLQLSILYISKNYYLYLIIKILMRVFENVCITVVANRLYSYLKDKDVVPLDKKIEKDIFKKVRALFFHQIGAFAINSTDNLVISKYIGLISVGLYSNYYLIINSVQTITNQIIDATTPSIGNMLVTESKERHFIVFKRMRFLNFWIACFCGLCIFALMEPFVKLWIGKKYLLETRVLIVLTMNFFQKTSRLTYKSFKTAAGIFYEDRFVPIIEAFLNIFISIMLAKYIGLVGVFIGTIVSGLVLWCFSYPKYVYKNLFDRSYLNYFIETLGYILLFVVLLITTSSIINLLNINNLFILLLVRLTICLIYPNIILLLLYFKTDNFNYYYSMIKNNVCKKIGKKVE